MTTAALKKKIADNEARAAAQIARVNARAAANEAFVLAERYRLAVAAHRAAAAGIAYKISQSPQFGAISASSLEEYERCRLELLEAEAEMSRSRQQRA